MTSERSFRHAVKWAYVMQVSEQGLNALFTFLFAALLGPKDFGTVAMAMAYILFIKLVLEQGFLPALVAKKDLRNEHLDSVFCLNLVVSLALVGLSIAVSKWWAAANHLPVLAPIISVLSFTLILEGLTIVQRAVLERALDFKSFSIRSIVANFFGGAVGLAMALKGFGVWALVGKQLSTDLLGLIVLWKLSHWRPGLSFSRPAIKDLLGYSLGSFTGNLGVWVNSQIDTLIIGLFFGPVTVGLYRLAGRLPFMIVSGTTNSLQAAAFPQFCRIRDTPEELRKSILSCFRTASILSIPALAGLAVISQPLLSILGNKWAGASTAMSILCVCAMIQTVAWFTAPLLQALSKTRFLAAIEWGNAILLAGSIALAVEFLRNDTTRGQVAGIAATRFATSYFVFLPFIVWVFGRFGGVRVSSILKVLMPSVLAAGVMALVVYSLSTFALWSGARLLPSLGAEVALGIVTASATLLLIDKELRGIASGFLTMLRHPVLFSWRSSGPMQGPESGPKEIVKDYID